MPLEFTPEQLQIFEFIENEKENGIIDAVAGAGKTTTIVECGLRLPADDAILFCAFNKSIQVEINSRFRAHGASNVSVRTMHALGFQILRTNLSNDIEFRIDENKPKSLFDAMVKENQTLENLREIFQINEIELDELNEIDTQWDKRKLYYEIRKKAIAIHDKLRTTLTPLIFDSYKSLCLHYGIYSQHFFDSVSADAELRLMMKLSEILLDKSLRSANRLSHIDFTDMLYLPYIQRMSPASLYEYVFIDECQDLSKAQLAIALKYARSNARILAVGDPRQSIYGFAGADILSFDRVKELIKAKELHLSNCFRCPKLVIERAKEVWPDIHGANLNTGVVTEIESNEVESNLIYGDLVLCRFRNPILVLVLKLVLSNRKVRIHPDEAKEFINDLAYLFENEERRQRIISNDFLVGLCNLARERRLKSIEREANRIADIVEREAFMKAEKDLLSDKLRFVEAFYEESDMRYSSLKQMFNDLKERVSSPDPCIKLSTIHRAKGLEEDRIFLLDHNLLPFDSDRLQPWEKIQEKNLLYVALTRAKKELYLVSQMKLMNELPESNLFDDLEDYFNAI